MKIKKEYIFINLFFLLTLPVQAQIFKIGVKGGINYANQIGGSITENTINYKSEAIVGYHLGVIGELAFTKKISFQPELIYSTQGADYSATGIAGGLKNRLGYVAIPALAKVYFGKTFSLEAGPQASFLLRNKNDFTISDTKTFDFGAVAGFGIKITEAIFVQGRYVVGLSDVSTNAKIKNSVIQVAVGFFF